MWVVRLCHISHCLGVEVSLDSTGSYWLLFLLTPVIEAVTPRTLLELTVAHIIADNGLLLLVRGACLVRGHINTEICDTANRLLPRQSALRVVDLGRFGSHVAASWPHFEMLLLV